MNKKENGLPRAIKALAMTNKGTFFPEFAETESKKKKKIFKSAEKSAFFYCIFCGVVI